MKFLILLTTVISCSFAVKIFDLDSLGLENTYFPLDEELATSFLEEYEAVNYYGDESQIVAVVNEYADKILENIEIFAVENGLDPVNLTDIEEEFLTASITLTHGLLHGISTISRSDDVEVIYQSSSKTLEIYLPILFSNLNFTYDYHLIILLIGPEGNFTGKIQNFEMDIKLSFDFNTYLAKVESINTLNTGHVDLVFHGNGILDLVINIISEFVSTILHPLIVYIIEGIVTDVAKLVVDAVNDFLDGILHPATDSTTDFVTDFTEDYFYRF